MLWKNQQIQPQQTIPQQHPQEALRVRNNREAAIAFPSARREHDNQTELSHKPIEPESTYYFQEIFANWNTVNFVIPRNFVNDSLSKYCPQTKNKIWIQTSSNNFKIDWIADTGSPRSFVKHERLYFVLQKGKDSI